MEKENGNMSHCPICKVYPLLDPDTRKDLRKHLTSGFCDVKKLTLKEFNIAYPKEIFPNNSKFHVKKACPRCNKPYAIKSLKYHLTGGSKYKPCIYAIKEEEFYELYGPLSKNPITVIPETETPISGESSKSDDSGSSESTTKSCSTPITEKEKEKDVSDRYDDEDDNEESEDLAKEREDIDDNDTKKQIQQKDIPVTGSKNNNNASDINIINEIIGKSLKQENGKHIFMPLSHPFPFIDTKPPIDENHTKYYHKRKNDSIHDETIIPMIVPSKKAKLQKSIDEAEPIINIMCDIQDEFENINVYSKIRIRRMTENLLKIMNDSIRRESDEIQKSIK